MPPNMCGPEGARPRFLRVLESLSLRASSPLSRRGNARMVTFDGTRTRAAPPAAHVPLSTSHQECQSEAAAGVTFFRHTARR